MTSSRRRRAPQQVDTSQDTPFRTAERYWKSRDRTSLDYSSRAFHAGAIEWDHATSRKDGKVRGVWRCSAEGNESGQTLECWRVELSELDGLLLGLGQSRWKGKERATNAVTSEQDYAIVVPAIPGLVVLPSILTPTLQRDLTRESLRHSVLPNLTSLSPHYALPQAGLWASYEAGRGEEVVQRIDIDSATSTKARRERLDFEPVTKDNWASVKDRAVQPACAELPATPSESLSDGHPAATTLRPATVRDLISKLRWTTIGWSYNWSSKTYDFDRPKTELPPLIYGCCRNVARAVPWGSVFDQQTGPEERQHDDEEEQEDEGWGTWSETYEPEAGVINFYQLKDSLTAHIDQSEVDAVRPLVSFSIGHSAIFLIGGPTRSTPPLAIRLDSGDGVIMSGRRGRRVFHGLPRVVPGSLPEYLKAGSEDRQHHDDPGVGEDVGARAGTGIREDRAEGEDQSGGSDDWRLFGEYLERGARINVNVRTVFS